MAVILELLFFAIPFAVYLIWWRFWGRQPGHVPSERLIGLAAVGVACALAGAVYYGLGRSFDRGEKYVPARIDGGEITRGQGITR